MLRDYDHRDHWHSIANAIGYIGDTSYFDTLRTLVRSRFRGTIDSYAFTAIQSAQGSLSAMAAISPRALDYLLASMNEADWNDLPWNVSGYTQRAVVRLLIKESQVSVAFTDVERARERIRTVPMPADSASSPGDIEVLWVQGLRTMSEKVRREGLIQVWAKEEGVTTEPGRGR